MLQADFSKTKALACCSNSAIDMGISGLDIGSLISSVASGGIGGAIVMLIVGILKKALTKA